MAMGPNLLHFGLDEHPLAILMFTRGFQGFDPQPCLSFQPSEVAKSLQSIARCPGRRVPETGGNTDKDAWISLSWGLQLPLDVHGSLKRPTFSAGS